MDPCLFDRPTPNAIWLSQRQRRTVGASAYTIPLTLDANFNQDTPGIVVDNSYGNTGSTNGAVAMAINNASGSTYEHDVIVAAPYKSGSSSTEWAVTAYEPDGAPDTNFGTLGRVLVPFSGGDAVPTAIAVDAFGNVAVAGNCASGWAAALIGGISAGVVWSKSGFVTTGSANAVAFDNGSNVIVAGAEGPTPSSCAVMAAVRLNSSTGALDTGFGSSGIATVSFNANEPATAYGAAVEPSGEGNGDLILAGNAGVSFCGTGYNEFALAALTLDPGQSDDGHLDTSFGSSGKKTLDFGDTTCNGAYSDDVAYALAIDPNNGRIIAAGGTDQTGATTFAAAAFSASGALDTGGFNSPHGFEAIDMTSGGACTNSSIAYGVAVQVNDDKDSAGRHRHRRSAHDRDRGRLRPLTSRQ